MTIMILFLIVLGAFFMLLFLYSLLKIAHISDVCAGYDEGAITQEEVRENTAS